MSGITYLTGACVTSVDLAARTAVLADAGTLSWDTLVIATGAHVSIV
jgi:NADPH-dependent 2,4-dienoyl-CoA reductase/sulfur reductase-like enzyme